MKQNGNFNEFYSVQNGDVGGHLITTADESDYFQNGYNNFMNIHQSGDSNSMEILQDGANSSSNISQNP